MSRYSSVGDLVDGAVCPGCKWETVVYNGNYFCEREVSCGWAMPERMLPIHRNIVQLYLNQRAEQAAESGDQDTFDRMVFYLERLEEERMK